MSDSKYSYEVDGNVVVWDLEGMVRATAQDVADLLEEMVDVAGRPAVEGSVSVHPTKGSLGGGVLDVIEQYGGRFEGVGLERVALVSDDVKNLAVKSRVDVDEVAVAAFDGVDAAVEWARGDA